MAPNAPLPFSRAPKAFERVTFSRAELSAILRIYGQMVACGEWRDYGVSLGHDAAVFSIFRRSAERPLYQIEKRPSLRNRQGCFALLAEGGRVLQRGNEIENILSALRRRLVRAVE